eukprot:CAMPEP_0119309246 /NCGR_PEP_ID=MMETSP1333-20130426/14413_1 /TAXON_ID=418940 /ORGANISM="Scyphosphaera apsteinii, Strain RCC1455" /LENGTH=68 /DNA_ID=CAMNT_0007313183 /DNA_START=32 /DNA_END=234 /DNA_ORIENTATION=+
MTDKNTAKCSALNSAKNLRRNGHGGAETDLGRVAQRRTAQGSAAQRGSGVAQRGSGVAWRGVAWRGVA